MQETWVRSLGQEDALEKGMVTHSSKTGQSRGERSLAGYSPWGLKHITNHFHLFDKLEDFICINTK